jgi:hypothetical protein
VTLVTTPMQPRWTTAPRKVSPSWARERVWRAPSAATNSRAAIEEERFWLWMPEP